jgi:hypothetical protein
VTAIRDSGSVDENSEPGFGSCVGHDHEL